MSLGNGLLGVEWAQGDLFEKMGECETWLLLVSLCRLEKDTFEMLK
jgi:hypothetical protein